MNIFLTFLFTVTSFSFATDYVSGNHTFINGHDPVSYHTENKALKGTNQQSYIYDGIKILFTSKRNKELFIVNPKKYMPAYNGWCAFAMARNGKLVSVNPKTFKIIDGKLYLFFNKFWMNTLKKWNEQGDATQIQSANKLWKKKHALK